jgi:hypothetical protein
MLWLSLRLSDHKMIVPDHHKMIVPDDAVAEAQSIGSNSSFGNIHPGATSNREF